MGAFDDWLIGMSGRPRKERTVGFHFLGVVFRQRLPAPVQNGNLNSEIIPRPPNPYYQSSSNQTYKPSQPNYECPAREMSCLPDQLLEGLRVELAVGVGDQEGIEGATYLGLVQIAGALQSKTQSDAGERNLPSVSASPHPSELACRA